MIIPVTINHNNFINNFKSFTFDCITVYYDLVISGTKYEIIARKISNKIREEQALFIYQAYIVGIIRIYDT